MKWRVCGVLAVLLAPCGWAADVVAPAGLEKAVPQLSGKAIGALPSRPLPGKGNAAATGAASPGKKGSAEKGKQVNKNIGVPVPIRTSPPPKEVERRMKGKPSVAKPLPSVPKVAPAGRIKPSAPPVPGIETKPYRLPPVVEKAPTAPGPAKSAKPSSLPGVPKLPGVVNRNGVAGGKSGGSTSSGAQASKLPRVPDLRLPSGSGKQSQAKDAGETPAGKGFAIQPPSGFPGGGGLPVNPAVGGKGRAPLPAPASGDLPAGATPAEEHTAQNSVVIRDVRFDNRHRAADGWPEWDLVVELENTNPAKPAVVNLGYNQYAGSNIRDFAYDRNRLLRGIRAFKQVFLSPGERKTIRIVDGGYTFTTCAQVRLVHRISAFVNIPVGHRNVCQGDPTRWRVVAEIHKLWSQYDGDDEGPTRWNVCWEVSGHSDCFQGYANDRVTVPEAQGRRLSFSVTNLRERSLDARVRIVDRDPGMFQEDDIGEGYAVVRPPYEPDSVWLNPVLRPEEADAYYLRKAFIQNVYFRKVGSTEAEADGPQGYLEIRFQFVPE